MQQEKIGLNCKNFVAESKFVGYLLFRFVCSLAVSMSTVLSIVYHLEVVQLDAFQLVLVVPLLTSYREEKSTVSKVPVNFIVMWRLQYTESLSLIIYFYKKSQITRFA